MAYTWVLLFYHLHLSCLLFFFLPRFSFFLSFPVLYSCATFEIALVGFHLLSLETVCDFAQHQDYFSNLHER